MLEKLFKDINTPSIQYMIFNKKSIIYSYINGFAELPGKKAGNTTSYNLYSVTKTFTALAVLQLVSSGKIKLDGPVLHYLPAFPYNKQVTVRHLLTHTSGIPNPIPLNWIHTAEEHPGFNREEFFNTIVNKTRDNNTEPGKKFKYSNIGYIILGRLIEKISGRSYEEYIVENILQKLDPQELSFVITKPQSHAAGYQDAHSFVNLLLGLFIDKKKFMGKAAGKWKTFNTFYVNDPAYGGLIGTANGLAAYIRELLKKDCSLLPPEYKAMLFSENILPGGKPTGMCMSWFKGSLRGFNFYTHAGGGGGYYSEIRIYPEAGVGSVLLLNRTGIKDERLLDKIDLYFLKPYKPVSQPNIDAELHPMP
jgi:D-alanyl-D-alanine carboxypeptidase